MNVVKELNNMCEKIVGSNPKATTDADAIKYFTEKYEEGYVLPVASASTLGGVKVGENLSIDENGVLSASGGSTGAVTYVINHVGNVTEQTEITDEAEISQLNAILQGALSGNVINCILRLSYTQEETDFAFIYGLKGINPQEVNDEYISIHFNAALYTGVYYTYLDNKWYIASE